MLGVLDKTSDYRSAPGVRIQRRPVDYTSDTSLHTAVDSLELQKGEQPTIVVQGGPVGALSCTAALRIATLLDEQGMQPRVIVRTDESNTENTRRHLHHLQDHCHEQGIAHRHISQELTTSHGEARLAVSAVDEVIGKIEQESEPIRKDFRDVMLPPSRTLILTGYCDPLSRRQQLGVEYGLQDLEWFSAHPIHQQIALWHCKSEQRPIPISLRTREWLSFVNQLRVSVAGKQCPLEEIFEPHTIHTNLQNGKIAAADAALQDLGCPTQ